MIKSREECWKRAILRDLISKRGMSKERWTNGSIFSHGENWCGYMKKFSNKEGNKLKGFSLNEKKEMTYNVNFFIREWALKWILENCQTYCLDVKYFYLDFWIGIHFRLYNFFIFHLNDVFINSDLLDISLDLTLSLWPGILSSLVVHWMI